MLSFVARLLGLLLFSIGLVSLIADGVASIAADAVVMTPLSASLALIGPDFADRLQAFVTGFAGPALWREWGPAVLAWPTLAVCGLPGIFLMLAGAKRAQKLSSGHAPFFSP